MSTSLLQPGRLAPYGALPVPQVTPELIGLIRTGTVYSLAGIYQEGITVPGPMVPYTLTPRPRHGDLPGIAPASVAAESITMSAHTGTHIDALCHFGEYQDEYGHPDPNGQVYVSDGNGRQIPAQKTESFRGHTCLSIAEMPPIVTRGVLLDVAGIKGELSDSYTITPDDLEETMLSQGTCVEPQTAVLIRTGYDHPQQRKGLDGVAGLGLDAAQVLVQRGMILVGADNMSVEAIPPHDYPVHRLLLVHRGITHLENLYLEDLAAQKVYEFLLIVTPLRLAGATGSWVHPIAIA